jgi:hypothetical protein
MTHTSLLVSTQKIRNAAMPGGANNDATKPPLATRHRAVMMLQKAVPLYNMRLNPSSSLVDILQSTVNAEKVMMTMSVSTDRVSRVEEDAKYLELVICFYPSGDTRDNENASSKFDVKVVMPEMWTPKMYLAALHNSTRLQESTP